LSSDETRVAFERDLAESGALGVQGFPSLASGGRIVSHGYRDAASVLGLLRDAGLLR